VEEAQAILFEHAKASIGSEKVHKVCATLMQFYWGDKDQVGSVSMDPESNIFSTLQPKARKTVQCYLRESNMQKWKAYRPSFDGIPSLSALDGMLLGDFVEILHKYAGFFMHKMKLRCLLLDITTCCSDDGYSICSMSLTPETGVLIARAG